LSGAVIHDQKAQMRLFASIDRLKGTASLAALSA